MGPWSSSLLRSPLKSAVLTSLTFVLALFGAAAENICALSTKTNTAMLLDPIINYEETSPHIYSFNFLFNRLSRVIDEVRSLLV